MRLLVHRPRCGVMAFDQALIRNARLEECRDACWIAEFDKAEGERPCRGAAVDCPASPVARWREPGRSLTDARHRCQSDPVAAATGCSLICLGSG